MSYTDTNLSSSPRDRGLHNSCHRLITRPYSDQAWLWLSVRGHTLKTFPLAKSRLHVNDCVSHPIKVIILVMLTGQSALSSGNESTNYSKPYHLNCVEALAGVFYIVNFPQYAERLLTEFRWGYAFAIVNQ
jgi:hypothetical protein